MTVAFEGRVRIPEDVLVSDLDGESVILNLKTESYFGLDEVGARMWAAVTTADSIEAGVTALTAEFDVEPSELRKDLSELLDTLLEHGLLELAP